MLKSTYRVPRGEDFISLDVIIDSPYTVATYGLKGVGDLSRLT
jgi:hypothetical protein